jgi:uncharacterized protein
MSEQFVPPTSEVTSDDKLWAALGYPIVIVAIIVLLMEEKKNRPFIKYHAVQAIAVNVAIFVLSLVLTAITFGIGGCLVPLLWIATLWPAYEAYQGKYLVLPVITNFIRNQGWVA